MAKKRSGGEGTIYFSEQTNAWVAQISLPNGKRKTKTAKNQKEVRTWLLQQRKALEEGLMIKDEAITLDKFMSRFLDDVVKHTLRPKTIESYTILIKKHILPELGSLRLIKLRPDHLQNLYSKKLEQGLSKRTVQYIHAIFRRALNQAVKWGLLNRNPANFVDAPRPTKKTPQTFSIDQAKQFLEAVKDYRWYPIYLLAITTGMREGELLGLHWEDVDLKNGQIHVQHQVQFISGQGLIITEPKTDGSRRTIDLSQTAIQVLEELGGGSGLVFKTSNDTPISPRNLQRHFHQTLDKVGLPNIRFHDLRHTAATLLLTQNVHPKIVQEMLGHSSISLTLDTYSHIIPTLQKQAAEKMEALLNA